VHSDLACGAAKDIASAFAAMRQNQIEARRRPGRRSKRAPNSRFVPATVFHGDQDMTVHPHNGDQVTAQLREALNSDYSQATVEKGREPGVGPTAASSIATRAGRPYLSNGSFTARAMPGRVAVPPGPIQSPKDRTPRARCSDSLSITLGRKALLPPSNRHSLHDIALRRSA
jgi:hypothetical protein